VRCRLGPGAHHGRPGVAALAVEAREVRGVAVGLHGAVQVLVAVAGGLDQVGLGAEVVADVGILVLSEEPYAEGEGDRADLHLPDADVALLQRVQPRCKRLVIILISGRPMILTEQLPLADALVAAWLPGTEGDGVAQALFGDYPFTGKLPYAWPRSMDQVSRKQGDDPLFPFGCGLP